MNFGAIIELQLDFCYFLYVIIITVIPLYTIADIFSRSDSLAMITAIKLVNGHVEHLNTLFTMTARHFTAMIEANHFHNWQIARSDLRTACVCSTFYLYLLYDRPAYCC